MTDFLKTLSKTLSLGPDRGPGVLSDSKAVRPPSEFETLAGQAYLDARRKTLTAELPPDLSVGAPFLEKNIPYLLIPSSRIGIAFGLPTQAFAFQTSGAALYLRRYGTSPGARFIVDVGGRTHLMVPGTRVVAPFENVGVIARSFNINADLGINTIYQGEARFIIEKLPDQHFEEPDSPDLPPWFNPIDLQGNLAQVTNQNSGPGWILSPNGTFWTFAACGARRIRIYLSDKDYPGATATGLVATNVVSFFFRETPFTYYEDSNTLAGTWKAFYSDLTKTVTWNTGDTVRAFEIDIAGYPENFEMGIFNSGGGSQYFLMQGVS